VTFSIEGFQTIIRENLIVEVGARRRRTRMAPTKKRRRSSRRRRSSTKQTGTATNITAAELRNILTSRDPFADALAPGGASTASTSAAMKPPAVEL
jgi:hypothetical protein